MLLFLLGLATCWRLNPLGASIQADNQIYFYISERAASGIPPHISEFDPKNALSMLLTALAMRVGRVFGADDLLAARALSITVAAAALPLVWMATRRLGANRWMAATAALTPLLCFDFFSLAVAGARPKVFLVFFELLWMLAATTGRPVLLGIATGCCFLVWQPALLLLAAACAPALFLERQRIRTIALVVAGTLLPILVYEAYFLWHGALGDQIYQSLVFPAVYSKESRDPLQTAMNVLFLKWPFEPRTLMFCSAALGVAAFWATALLHPRRVITFVRENPARLALVLAASGTFGFSLLDYQGFPDRFFLLPYFAILAGVVLGGFAQRLAGVVARALPSRAPGLRISAGRAWTGTACMMLAGLLLMSQVPNRGRNGLASQREAAQRIAELAESGKTIYAIGPLHLLALERINNFTRYGFFPLRIRAHMNDRMRKEKPLLPLVDGKLPDVVLVSRMEYRGNTRWLEQYYKLKRKGPLRSQYTEVWKRIPEREPPAKAFSY